MEEHGEQRQLVAGASARAVSRRTEVASAARRRPGKPLRAPRADLLPAASPTTSDPATLFVPAGQPPRRVDVGAATSAAAANDAAVEVRRPVRTGRAIAPPRAADDAPAAPAGVADAAAPSRRREGPDIAPAGVPGAPRRRRTGALAFGAAVLAVLLGALVAVGVLPREKGTNGRGTTPSVARSAERERVPPDALSGLGPEAASELAEENRALREEIATLEDETTGLQKELLALELRLAALEPDGTARAAEPSSRSDASSSGPATASAGIPDRALLAAGGMDAVTIELIVSAFARAASELALIEQGAADPAADPADVETARRRVRDELLATVGPTNYVAGRHAAGEPNRTRLDSVPAGGAAARIGIAPDDVLLGIDGRRVFDLDDVGRFGAGEGPYEIELLRGGERLTVVVDVPPAALPLAAESIAPADYGL